MLARLGHTGFTSVLKELSNFDSYLLILFVLKERRIEKANCSCNPCNEASHLATPSRTFLTGKTRMNPAQNPLVDHKPVFLYVMLLCFEFSKDIIMQS